MRSAHRSRDWALTHRAAIVGLAGVTVGCAGSTVGSGVGDRLVERPPYYAGSIAPNTARIGHLPVAYQRGAMHDAMFDPEGDPSSSIAGLLAEMNAYLESLGATVPLRVTGSPPSRPPDVRFGCETDATGDCERDQAFDVRNPKLHLSVARPTERWTQWLGGVLDGANASHALLLTVEVSQYWTRQTNFRGSKEVQLGTGYAVGLPWLTSLDAPVSVLQLTGALVDRNGRAVRIGAEGMLPRRTSLVLASEGGQVLITDQDVENLRTSRRDDLSGRPLVWQVAIDHLVRELTGRVVTAAP